MLKPNLDELMFEAGIPTSEAVLLDELRKVKAHNYELTNALRNARGQLKQVRHELSKLTRENKKNQKLHYRNGQKRGKNGFNG